MILQLSPSIPMEVIGKGTGEAILVIDPSTEHDLLWVIALDSNGEIWAAQNKDVRLIQNYSLGRIFNVKKQ